MHLQDQILILLHFVAHQGKYGLLSDRFGLTRSCYHRCVEELLDIVVGPALRKFISWPDANRQKETADYFNSKYGFPGVVGSIEGTHITMSRPPGKFFPEDYFSVRKKIYNVAAGVCCQSYKNLPPPLITVGWLGVGHHMFKILDPPPYNRRVVGCWTSHVQNSGPPPLQQLGGWVLDVTFSKFWSPPIFACFCSSPFS